MLACGDRRYFGSPFSGASIEMLGDVLIENVDNTVALLSALREAGIDSPAALKAELDLASQFRRMGLDTSDEFT